MTSVKNSQRIQYPFKSIYKYRYRYNSYKFLKLQFSGNKNQEAKYIQTTLPLEVKKVKNVSKDTLADNQSQRLDDFEFMDLFNFTDQISTLIIEHL